MKRRLGHRAEKASSWTERRRDCCGVVAAVGAGQHGSLGPRVATDLLYQRGLDGIGVAELCATIGVSKETLYRHFGSKEGLMRAVLRNPNAVAPRW